MSVDPLDGFAPLDPADVERHVHALCAIGNRYVGGRGEAAAREYVLAQFREHGLEGVHTEGLSVRTYACRSASVTVPAWDLALECAGFPATASGEVEAEAVYLGRGQSAEEVLVHVSRMPSLSGRIAVFQSYWPWEIASQLAERGVAAMVLVSESPDNQIAHLPARSYGLLDPGSGHGPLPVPGVIVGAGTGASLVAALANGARTLRLRHEALYRETATENLLGDVAAQPGTETVIVAAHYDTYPVGVGAHDNASGLAGMLAMLPTWRGRQPKRTVRFASFAAEELGLCGATEYCRRHPRVRAEGDAIELLDIGLITEAANAAAYLVHRLASDEFAALASAAR